MNERTPESRVRPGSARLLSRRFGRCAALFFVAVIGLFVSMPGTAFADNEIVTSEPADGATVATSPPQIVFNFTEEIGDLQNVGVECNTEAVIVPGPTLSGNNRVMTVDLADTTLPKGLCVATWTVSNTESEPNGSGQISFQIETDATSTTTTAPTTETTVVDDSTVAGGSTATTGGELTPAADAAATDTAAQDESAIIDLADVTTGTVPLWIGRVFSTLGIAVVFGALVVIAAAWPEGVEYLITVRFLRGAWVVALLGTLFFTAAAAAAVSGSSLASGFNPASWIDLLDAGWSGRAALLRLVLVFAMAWSAFRPDRVIDPVTQLAALGIPALAVAMIGVGRVNGPLVVIGVGLGIVHALAMAIWLGGVILLARVVLSGPGEEDLVHAVRGFARISVTAIVVTIGTGLAQMFRLDGGNLFNNSHGRVTVLKVVLVAGMVFVGLSARQFAQQRLSRAHEMNVPMSDRLRRAFGMEASIGLVVLLASSWLMALSPVNVNSEESIDYAIERRVQVADGETSVVDITVKLTSDRVGLTGLEVRVDDPEEGISQLEIVLTPPANDVFGEIVQAIPLTGAGRAVRSAEVGLPIQIPGSWLLQINADTELGLVRSDPLAIEILPAEGTEATTTTTTVPAPILVPIETTTTVAG